MIAELPELPPPEAEHQRELNLGSGYNGSYEAWEIAVATAVEIWVTVRPSNSASLPAWANTRRPSIPRRRVSPDTALRFSRAFGVSDGFWVAIQNDYDVESARDTHAEEIAAVETLVHI